jgi:hypothetical protein
MEWSIQTNSSKILVQAKSAGASKQSVLRGERDGSTSTYLISLKASGKTSPLAAWVNDE